MQSGWEGHSGFQCADGTTQFSRLESVAVFNEVFGVHAKILCTGNTIGGLKMSGNLCTASVRENILFT